MRITESIGNQIDALILEGKTSKEIIEIVGCGHSTITKRRGEILKMAGPGSKDRLAWLLKNWHWSGEINRLTAPIKRRSADGYRIVYKGEIGHLRTPYRPDRRFQ